MRIVLSGLMLLALLNCVGAQSLSGVPVTGLPAPVNPSDAATKAYVDQAIGGSGRMRLTAPLTLWFDNGGSDTNPGTFAQPFKTPRHCADAAAFNYDTIGFQVTCKSVSAQTYTNPAIVVGTHLLGQIDPCGLLFDGNGSTFTDNTGGNIFQTGNFGAGGTGIPLKINNRPAFCTQNMKLSSPNGVGMGFQLTGGTVIGLGGMEFGAFGGYAILAEGAGASFTMMYGALTITAGAQVFAGAQAGGEVVIQGENITLANCAPGSSGCSSDGWPLFTQGFLDAEFFGMVFYGFPTVTGQARGPQYSIKQLGMIVLAQSPSAPIPGNQPGSCQYTGLFNWSPCAGSQVWTPSLVGSSGGSWTWTVNNASYEIGLGGTVAVRFTLIASGTSGAPSGNLQITGLPTPARSGLGAHDDGACDISVYSGITFSPGYSQIGGYINPGQAAINLTQSGSGQPFSYLTAGNVSALPTLVGKCSYPQ